MIYPQRCPEPRGWEIDGNPQRMGNCPLPRLMTGRYTLWGQYITIAIIDVFCYIWLMGKCKYPSLCGDVPPETMAFCHIYFLANRGVHEA